MEDFYNALMTALRADGPLISLTGNTATDIKIGRAMPITTLKKPYLGIAIDSTPFIGSDVTHVQKSIVQFQCCGNELTSIRIADRIEVLLHDKGNPSANLRHFDFSSDDITVKMCSFMSRISPKFTYTVDVWVSIVTASVIWHNQKCPYGGY